jgi:hypothetical protein
MHQTFIIAGVVCIIASIVGGGLKAFGIEMPILNSTPRQIILGIVGIIFLFLGMGWNNGSDVDKPTVTVDNKDSTSTLVTPVQEMRIIATSDPQIVRANKETKINVLIFKPDNTPIEGVKVKITAPGGYFKNSANRIETGITDSQGRFNTNWKAPLHPVRHPYQINVSAIKEGFTESSFHFSVSIGH